MTFKKKFKRFRKEWFYTGVLAFLTTCLIGLILFTSFIISNAEEFDTSGSIIKEDDLIIKDDIINDLESVDLNINDYGYCFGNGYTDTYSDDIYNPSLTYLSNYLSGHSYSCYNRDFDFEEQETVYNTTIEDIVFSSEDLVNAPYLVQVSSGGTYMYKFFFLPTSDNEGHFTGFSDLPSLRIFNRYVFLPNNSIVLDVYLSDNDSISAVDVNSVCVNSSGYFSFFYNDDEEIIDFVTYDRVPNGYDMVATNISIIGIKINDINNDYGLPDGSSLFNDADMTSTMKLFYKSIGISVEMPYKVSFKPFSTSENDGGVYPDGSGGDDDNNLVLDGSDWIFKNSGYTAPYNNAVNTGSIYPNGSCTFTANLNDYQKDNLGNFEVVYSFYFDLDVNYKNWGSNDIGPFKKTSQLLNTKKNYKARFVYDFNNDPRLMQSLDDFNNNGCSRSFTFQQLFDNLYSQRTLSNLLLQMKELDEVEYNKFNITCVAWLDSKNTVNSSGTCEEWYNPMTKKGYTLDDSSKTNPNPYIPDEDDQGNEDVTDKPQAPGPGGNEPTTSEPSTSEPNNPGTTTTGNGNVIVNNNPTFNNNVSGGTSGGSNKENESMLNFYNTFSPFSIIFGKLVGDNKADTDAITEVTGANPFLRLMSQVFGFLPSQLWVVLLGFLTTCLGIVVVAFVLRIILDLL